MTDTAANNRPKRRGPGRPPHGHSTAAKTRTVPVAFDPEFTLDRRLGAGKIVAQREEQLAEECGATSYARRSLVRRAIHMEMVLETHENRVLAKKKGLLSLAVYAQSINTYVGLLKTLGLDRRVKDVSLGEYLKNVDEANAGEECES